MLISSAIFILLSLSLCASVSASHAHFILRIFTARLCCSPLLFCSNLLLSAWLTRNPSLDAPLTTRPPSPPTRSLLLSSLFVVFRFRVNALLRTLPLVFNHARFLLRPHSFGRLLSVLVSYVDSHNRSPSVWLQSRRTHLAHLYNNFFFLFAFAHKS